MSENLNYGEINRTGCEFPDTNDYLNTENYLLRRLKIEREALQKMLADDNVDTEGIELARSGISKIREDLDVLRMDNCLTTEEMAEFKERRMELAGNFKADGESAGALGIFTGETSLIKFLGEGGIDFYKDIVSFINRDPMGNPLSDRNIQANSRMYIQGVVNNENGKKEYKILVIPPRMLAKFEFETSEYAEIVYRECEKYGIDPNIILSIIATESKYGLFPKAWSKVHQNYCLGFMQLSSAAVEDLVRDGILTPEQGIKAREQDGKTESNIAGGIGYYAVKMLPPFEGNPDQVLYATAAYTGGLSRILNLPGINPKKTPFRVAEKLLRKQGEQGIKAANYPHVVAKYQEVYYNS